MLRVSVACEATGIPTVSLICEGFQRQAAATGRGLGFGRLPLAMLRGHVDTQSYDEMVTSFVEHTVPQVIAGLTTPIDHRADATVEPSALDIVASGTIDDIHRTFASRGWSDGLAIIPPTRERVEAFIAPSGNDPWRVLGTARPSGRELTVWSLAVNAVMAGCLPEHLPVLLAITEALLDPRYGVEHSGNTTGADALVVLNGAVIDELGFNHGPGALADLVAEGHLPALFAVSVDPDRLVPVVTAPEHLLIAVAGDPNRTNAYVLRNDGAHGNWTSAPIDRAFRTDLVCSINNRVAHS